MGRTNFYIPLQIAFNTGMRAAEVMSLTWDCINLDSVYIRVEKILYRAKYNNWFFCNTLISLLRKHAISQKENKLKYGEFYNKNNADYVCLNENGTLLTTDSLKYLSRIVNYELGINFKFHSLRHTHATMLLESGANIKDIQIRLGHSKLATTMDVYSHVTKKMAENSVNIFESIINNKIPTC